MLFMARINDPKFYKFRAGPILALRRILNHLENGANIENMLNHNLEVGFRYEVDRYNAI